MCPPGQITIRAGVTRMGRFRDLAVDLPLLALHALRHPDRESVLEEYVRLEMTRPDWRQLEWATYAKDETTFEWDGRPHAYFYHPYHYTWANERTVEIPLLTAALEEARGRRTLEVGNVSGHYLPRPPGLTVVDKYERGDRVTNVDIVDYEPPERFDRIVSISTIEHIGWDERPRDAGKVGRALERLHALLAPGGRAFVTVPLGHNPHLDDRLGHGPLFGGTLEFLRRVSWDNRWRVSSAAEVRDAVYGDWKAWRADPSHHPYPFANAIAVIRWTRPP